MRALRLVVLSVFSLCIFSGLAGTPAISDFFLMGHDGNSNWANPLLVRVDQDGNVVWQVSVPLTRWYDPGPSRTADRNVTEDSFYITSVFPESQVGGLHRILKYNKSGVLEWDRPIAPPQMHINANPVLGGLYAAAGSELIRIDADGNVVWRKTFPNPILWATTDVTSGAPYIVGGAQTGAVSKLDASGAVVWTKTLDPHIPYQMLSNPLDGGLYVGCDEYVHYTARLGPNGSVLWWITDFPVPWPSGGTAYGRTVEPGSGALYIGGWYGRYGKVAANGVPLWNIQTPTYNGYADARLDGNGVYVSGNYANAGIEKRDGNGNLVWQKWMGPASWNGGFYDMPSVYVGAPAVGAPQPPGCSPDTTAPVLTVAGVTVNATGPTGATLSDAMLGFSASDDCSAVTVSRTPSGNLFAIGATTVHYDAADASGNHATATQVVTVIGASGQASNLLASIASSAIDNGTKNSISQKLDNAAASIARQSSAACNQLAAFINEVNAQSGKKIPTALAAEWVAGAANIRAVVGCL